MLIIIKQFYVSLSARNSVSKLKGGGGICFVCCIREKD